MLVFNLIFAQTAFFQISQNLLYNRISLHFFIMLHAKLRTVLHAYITNHGAHRNACTTAIQPRTSQAIIKHKNELNKAIII